MRFDCRDDVVDVGQIEPETGDLVGVMKKQPRKTQEKITSARFSMYICGQT